MKVYAVVGPVDDGGGTIDRTGFYPTMKDARAARVEWIKDQTGIAHDQVHIMQFDYENTRAGVCDLLNHVLYVAGANE